MLFPKTIIWSVIFVLLQLAVKSQAPYPNYACSLASRICSGQSYTYEAWTGNNLAQSGPYYGCLATQPDPAWFWFEAGEPGDIHIYMYAVPCMDIDFICWGPFDSLGGVCNGGLLQSKVIDCSYSSLCYETCDLPAVITGKYYVLLITNFSRQACEITFSQTSGNGSMNCLLPPLLSNNSPLCEGDTLQLTAGFIQGASYTWSGPGGFVSALQNPQIPLIQAAYGGTYELTVTVGSVTLGPVYTLVTVNPLPQPDIIANTSICLGDGIVIGGLAQSGESFQWTSDPPGFSSNLPNPFVNPAISTSYFLTVTSAEGCQAVDSVSITVLPVPYAFVIPDAGICLGSSVPLGSIPNPQNTYQWTSDPPGFQSTLSNPIVSPAVSSTYYLIVTNQFLCSTTYSTSITVYPLPAAITGNDQGVCPGNTATLGEPPISGNTWSWTSNPPGFFSTVSNPVVQPQVSTTYYLTETNTATNCSNTDSVTVTVYPLPVVNTGPATAICLGSTHILGAPPIPGYSYLWASQPSGFTSTLADPTISPQTATTYFLTVTSDQGCPATGSVGITVNPLPQANTGPPQSVCTGSYVSLGAIPVSGNTYQWTSTPPGFYSFISNPLAYLGANTTFHLTETITATGCTKTNAVLITAKSLPVVSLQPFPQVCKQGPPLQLTGGSPPGGNYLGIGISGGYFNPAGLFPGYYTVFYSYTNSQGCTGTAIQTLTLINKPVIDGLVVYANTQQSPMNNTKVKLYDAQENLLDSTLSDPAGVFRFVCLENGNYKLQASTAKAWGGANTVDALLMAKYSVGLEQFTPLQVTIADVNLSGTVNAGDALLVMRRWANIISAFPAGDWYFTDTTTITVSGQDVSPQISACCYGDVNASYQPPLFSSKTTDMQTLRLILLPKYFWYDKKNRLPAASGLPLPVLQR
ncbi:MAG TPA: hypothetical protein P5531_12500 [Bacteroidales bacterium]|nr:hypothetical protein [Bacteroidales bacterium]HSA44339.1 hypothetical protein [Bacteroidales bacterium]